MGSYANLRFNEKVISSMKSFVFPECACLFSEFEKTVSKKVEVYEDGEKTEYDVVEYKTTASKAGERLFAMGFTPESSMQAVADSISQDAEGDDDEYHGTIRAKRLLKLSREELLEKISFLQDYWNKSETKDDDVMRDVEEFVSEALENDAIDIRHIYSLQLSGIKGEVDVILDVSDLINGGYYSLDDDIIKTAKEEALKDVTTNERVLILTEGSSDVRMLKESIEMLAPHLADRFGFLDYSMRPAGGAPELVKLIKAFIASGVRSKIIAIFDNDTAARDALRSLDQKKLPSNVGVIHLPNLAFAERYPTIGPQGTDVEMNINGLAVSMELFVCQDLLTIDGQQIPIQWGGYFPSIGNYQGEIQKKGAIAEEYSSRILEIKKGSHSVDDYDWSSMRLLIEEILRKAGALS